jgi:hypothetical protein
MSMMILFAAAALMAQPEINQPTIGPSPDHCVPEDKRVSQTEVAAGPRKLSEMPPAEPHYAVVRNFGGCPIPVTLRKQGTKRR